jgi:phage terminase large subunit
MTVAAATAEKIAEWRRDIRKFAWDNFEFTPDAWQGKVFDYWDAGDQRIAMQACKGPGKTAIIAILIWHFLATRPHANVAATSITGDNLADCLWTELARWHQKSPLLLRAFVWTKTRIACRDHPETWWASARTWSQSANPEVQGQTLAGLHANYMLFVLDETGGMPEAILVAAEAALASGIEVRIVQAGNPIQCEGPLWVAANRDRRLWKIVEITGDPDDPLRSPRIDPTWAAEQIRSHGRENPWVMANVLGKFPSASPLAFISSAVIEGAVRREATANITDPLIIGVDVARFGDDKTVIRFRKGRDARTIAPIKLRNLDNIQVAARIATIAREMQADAIFVDGGGNGGGVVDALRAMRVPGVYEIQFGASPDNLVNSGEAAHYANKAAEMYGLMREWLKGGAIDDDAELRADLSTRRYAFKMVSGHECIILEPKDAMKQRGLASPDDADALALTFALPVQPSARAGFHGAHILRPANRVATDYDPFAWAEEHEPAAARMDFDPFRNPPPGS